MPKKSKSLSGSKPTNPTPKVKRSRTRDALSRLEARLDQLQLSLDRASEERVELLSQLKQAAQDRDYLQSQLEWVLYRLEGLNPEQMQSTLWRLEEWLNGGPSQTALDSEVGMDYSQLQNLLASLSWRQADEYTWAIVLAVAGRESSGWLSLEDIEKFPCADLRTIDRLWEQYSNGRFGLSVQQRLWQSADSDYSNFCDRVGWRAKDGWLYYDNLSFSLNAPEGHLPVIGWRRRACYGVGQSTAGESIACFASRFVSCNVSSKK